MLGLDPSLEQITYIDWHGLGQGGLHRLVQEAVEVAGVASSHTCSADGVLQNQVPADQEGDTLA